MFSESWNLVMLITGINDDGCILNLVYCEFDLLNQVYIFKRTWWSAVNQTIYVVMILNQWMKIFYCT